MVSMNRQEKFVLYTSIAIFVVAISLSILLPENLANSRPGSSTFIGLTLESEGDVKMRFGESINWQTLTKKDKIFSKIYLFTGKNSEAKFAFLDESFLKLGPNSLIYLDAIVDSQGKIISDGKKPQLSLDLVEGDININLKGKSLISTLKVGNKEVLTNSDETNLKIKSNDNEGSEVSVLQGSANVKSDYGERQLESGEKLAYSPQAPEPSVEKIPDDIMEEMRKMSEEERTAYLYELQKKRGFAQIAQTILNLFK